MERRTGADLPPLNGVDLDTVRLLMASIERNPENAAMSWRAHVRWDGGLRSTARVRQFAPLPSDEPEAIGGSDTAPNPVEQLLAALGNCFVVGYAMNASVRGIEIRELSVEVEGDLDLDVFMGLRDGDAGFTAIRARVHLVADADDDATGDLHRVVFGASPVGHTLANPVAISVELV